MARELYTHMGKRKGASGDINIIRCGNVDAGKKAASDRGPEVARGER